MIFPALIVVLALLLYLVFTVNVMRARGKYGIKAPATTGHPEFERYLRVQMNTLEQLIAFLPSLWLFGVFWMGPLWEGAVFWTGPHVAATVGAVWIVGRILYAKGYYANAEKRYLGMMLTLLSTTILLLGALGGIVKKLLVLYPVHF